MADHWRSEADRLLSEAGKTLSAAQLGQVRSPVEESRAFQRGDDQTSVPQGIGG